MFAVYDIPKVVHTDNAPPFNSNYFTSFAQYLGFKHRWITPRWPHADGHVEHFMKTLKKITPSLSCRRQSVAPRAVSQLSSNTIFINWSSTRNPIGQSTNSNKSFRTTTEAYWRHFTKRDARQKMKLDADSRENTNKMTIKLCDTVLVRRDKHVTKIKPTYLLEPYTE